ncbi:MAG: acyl-CoA carboxylase subunit epsilon [Actinocrinis sp.]
MTEPVAKEAAAVDGVSAESAPPVFSVVRGEPTDEELAALITVIASLRGAEDEEPAPRTTSGWTDRARYVRTPLRPSPNGWRASALPH